jgi:hypothetical protein
MLIDLSGMMVNTRTKFAEAKYFLDVLPQMANNPDGFYYNLSAFLTAWRSTLDVMLYDLAEHFSLGFSREDEMSVARAYEKMRQIIEEAETSFAVRL